MIEYYFALAGLVSNQSHADYCINVIIIMLWFTVKTFSVHLHTLRDEVKLSADIECIPLMQFIAN